MRGIVSLLASAMQLVSNAQKVDAIDHQIGIVFAHKMWPSLHDPIEHFSAVVNNNND